jgi:hypothetical protein
MEPVELYKPKEFEPIPPDANLYFDGKGYKEARLHIVEYSVNLGYIRVYETMRGKTFDDDVPKLNFDQSDLLRSTIFGKVRVENCPEEWRAGE